MGFNDFNIVGDSQHCLDMGGNITCNVLDPDNLKPLNDIYNYSLLHLNIRSLNKYSDLVSLLSNSSCHFYVIGCSETWLNDFSYVDLLNLDGYNLHIN